MPAPMLPNPDDDTLRGERRIGDFLGVAPWQVPRLMRQGAIPAVEVRGELRMSRAAYWRRVEDMASALGRDD
jgi:hypothetical protein